ncbi:hypothetical protein [Legionella gresilensis]|uniref:hypothetical protein n=1 Tax=Legionella gresilensis TaxID=91823 RepID=UPI001041969E|nr:hypothetical protein [Legionella gresilensis]
MKLVSQLYKLVCILCLTGCNYPADPNNTLITIKNNHVIKIGLCSNLQQNASLLNKLSQGLNARILKVVDSFDNLYKLLEKNEINLISCDIEEDNPWREKVAFTRPYEKNYVWVVQQGENAWLSYLDRFIYFNRNNNN